MSHPHSDELLSRIKKVYGSFDVPNFSFVGEAIDSRPHEDIISKITALGFACEENTDPNCDVSFNYQLYRGGRSWDLALSMVGPFALVTRGAYSWGPLAPITPNEPGLSKPERKLHAALCSYGLQLLSKEELEEPIPLKLFNTDPGDVRVYQALFSDVGIPWQPASVEADQAVGRRTLLALRIVAVIAAIAFGTMGILTDPDIGIELGGPQAFVLVVGLAFALLGVTGTVAAIICRRPARRQVYWLSEAIAAAGGAPILIGGIGLAAGHDAPLSTAVLVMALLSGLTTLVLLYIWRARS